MAPSGTASRGECERSPEPAPPPKPVHNPSRGRHLSERKIAELIRGRFQQPRHHHPDIPQARGTAKPPGKLLMISQAERRLPHRQQLPLLRHEMVLQKPSSVKGQPRRLGDITAPDRAPQILDRPIQSDVLLLDQGRTHREIWLAGP